MPTTRNTAAVASAVLLALAAGCAGTPASKSKPPASVGLASPAPSAIMTGTPATAASGPGNWTSTADLPAPVSDGTVVAGITRNQDRVQAVDALTGRALWDVPLPLAPGATPGTAMGTARSVMLAAPRAPLVATLTEDTPGSGLSPAATRTVATALDASTGRRLWTANGPANYLDSAAVLTGAAGVDTSGSTTTALDPGTGTTRWTRPGEAVGLDGQVAVLSRSNAGISTVLTAVDTATGTTLWSSADWVKGAQGSRSRVIATGAGQALVETTRSDPAGDSTSLRVRDLRTGTAVGPDLPQPANPTALVDAMTEVAVVSEQTPDGASTGPYGVDLRTGRLLWHLTAQQSAKAETVGGGLAWVQGADGYVALDDRTGKARAQGLPDYPLLALPGEQVTAGDTGLTATPLPR